MSGSSDMKWPEVSEVHKPATMDVNCLLMNAVTCPRLTAFVMRQSGSGGVSVIYCCMTNDPKSQRLKTTVHCA